MPAAHSKDIPGEEPSKRGEKGEPDAVFEIHVVDGEESERLAQQQTKVLEWYARQHQSLDLPEDT